MTAKTTVVGSRKSAQSLERSAGTPEPADPAAHYRVEPGETHAEYFPGSLAGLVAAGARAGFLSVGHPPQRVLATRAKPRGPLPACQDQVLSRWRGGRQLWAAASRTPDPGDDPPLDLRLRAI
jgi:hypothetical protein